MPRRGAGIVNYLVVVESLLNTYLRGSDMFDIVFPDKNERDFIEMAVRLGFSGLVFVYQDKSNFFNGDSAIPVVNALLVDPNKISKARAAHALAFCETADARAALEHKADVVFGLEDDEREDKTHYRISGLNQVLCRIAAENKVAIGFSFAKILSTFGSKRAKLMGRMMQNIVLCRKFKSPMRVGSFAKDSFSMRSPGDLAAFFQQLGMTSGEVRASMAGF